MKKSKMQDDEVVKSDRIVIDKHSDIRTINTGNIFSKCHTFKLASANMLKDISPFKSDPQIIVIEHCHIFHSFDSSGKEQHSCNSVGGHHHDIELKVVDGEWRPICSPPISNKASRELVKNDNHTHRADYLKTEEVQIRMVSPEAMRLVDEMQRQG